MKPHVREIYQRLLNLGAQVPWLAIEALAATLEEGGSKKYRTNPMKWRSIPADSHLESAMRHWHQEGDEPDEATHYAHYIARSMMAGEQLLKSVEKATVSR